MKEKKKCLSALDVKRESVFDSPGFHLGTNVDFWQIQWDNCFNHKFYQEDYKKIKTLKKVKQKEERQQKAY